MEPSSIRYYVLWMCLLAPILVCAAFDESVEMARGGAKELKLFERTEIQTLDRAEPLSNSMRAMQLGSGCLAALRDLHNLHVLPIHQDAKLIAIEAQLRGRRSSQSFYSDQTLPGRLDQPFPSSSEYVIFTLQYIAGEKSFDFVVKTERPAFGSCQLRPYYENYRVSNELVLINIELHSLYPRSLLEIQEFWTMNIWTPFNVVLRNIDTRLPPIAAAHSLEATNFWYKLRFRAPKHQILGIYPFSREPYPWTFEIWLGTEQQHPAGTIFGTYETDEDPRNRREDVQFVKSILDIRPVWLKRKHGQ